MPTSMRYRERPTRVAAVHHCGSELDIGGFPNRKSIGVRTQSDHPLPRSAAAQHTDDTVPGNAGTNLVEPQRPKLFNDQSRGRSFPVGKLWMGVNVATPSDDRGFDRSSSLVDASTYPVNL